jgi:hypothetical protein
MRTVALEDQPHGSQKKKKKKKKKTLEDRGTRRYTPQRERVCIRNFQMEHTERSREREREVKECKRTKKTNKQTNKQTKTNKPPTDLR